MPAVELVPAPAVPAIEAAPASVFEAELSFLDSPHAARPNATMPNAIVRIFKARTPAGNDDVFRRSVKAHEIVAAGMRATNGSPFVVPSTPLSASPLEDEPQGFRVLGACGGAANPAVLSVDPTPIDSGVEHQLV